LIDVNPVNFYGGRGTGREFFKGVKLGVVGDRSRHGPGQSPDRNLGISAIATMKFSTVTGKYGT